MNELMLVILISGRFVFIYFIIDLIIGFKTQSSGLQRIKIFTISSSIIGFISAVTLFLSMPNVFGGTVDLLWAITDLDVWRFVIIASILFSPIHLVFMYLGTFLRHTLHR